ncbi:MAG: thiamine diphosphokinase [Chloroflexi bacterium]|nr:thiamine diphosphokinase [Chloroflexota bacterium]
MADRAAMRALVLADGTAPTRAALDAAWPGWSDGIQLVVAADGGARLGPALGLRIDRWVGDGDSLGEAALAELRATGIPVERASADKDESDTELAVRAALDAGASDVTILGALGGQRFDHALANVALLALPAQAGCAACLLGPEARVRLLAGPGELDLGGRVGDLVSLLPLGEDVEGVVTEGLRYPLHDEPLRAGPARGLSNVRAATQARVAIGSGRLVVVEIPGTLAP